ncbi:pyridoxamine 5'-phosphate oxidase family protein [Pseudomonas asplenii]|uniref:pyridoxamine 5'-phosphate oxidase family protein n=1 Tax=Pseudomonas asplenii TaxID=53407 RepID=UPI00235E9D1B|nr:pyridoxamine 5'-phosphate oxidase family protein [Pseudomonas asplenii]
MKQSGVSPWHAGERQMQARVGVAERMAELGTRVVRDYMPDQHRDFFRQLPFMLLGAVDEAGRPWASLFEGEPGFAFSPDPKHLLIDSFPQPEDPTYKAVRQGAALGLLGIELHTRRRNRINGRIHSLGEQGLDIVVEHSFGNCPQYIQLRQFERVAPVDPAQRVVHRGTTLDPLATAMIRQADTFFVASYVDIDGARSVDVSHRGGQSGFVRVEGDCLTIPDFSGNLFFNTLGNLLVNPRAGLLFIDFNSGDLLQLSGRTEIILDGPLVKAFQGAERLWTFHVEHVVHRPAGSTLRWKFEGFSPNSLMTGNWQQAAARLQAEALGNSWRPLRIERIVEESRNIRSLYLQPADGAGSPLFLAGQHLPLRFNIDGQTHIRTYSLSGAPSDPFLRISVKRDGRVSSHIHDHLQVGDLLEARAPQGHFTVASSAPRPLVLLAAGVGITPLLSMLREVVYQGQRTRRMRPTVLFLSARSLAELPFTEELDELMARAGETVRVVRLLSQPEAQAVPGRDYDVRGRLSVEVMQQLLRIDDYDAVDFVLCGPGGFTQDLYDQLRDRDIRDEQIHAETFGPSTLSRRLDPGARQIEQPPAATVAVPVLFQRSAKEARWQPEGESLLALAESRGLRPEFSCRGGSCGTCSTRLISGRVHYPRPPAELPGDGQVLICCAVPAQGEEPLVLDL